MNNLRQSHRSGRLPDVLNRCKAAFDKLVFTHVRNPLEPGTQGIDVPGIADSSQMESRRLVEPPTHIAEAFKKNQDPRSPPLSRRVRKLNYIKVKDFVCSVPSRHRGNSLIMVQDRPYCIEFMMQDPNAVNPAQVLIVASRFKKVSLPDDPFPTFPLLGAGLWKRSKQYSILDASLIQSHFVCRNTKWANKDVAIILPLNKVVLLDNQYNTDRLEDDDSSHFFDTDAVLADGEDMSILEV
ncbi:hypothetical protein IW262DRAFT_1013559 [Armillaria fumosa]|nr:hypothetical protein IW262DRAFT_1013559 [Armillaria fumosa]